MNTGVRRIVDAARMRRGFARDLALSRLRRRIVGPHVQALLVDCGQGRFLARLEDTAVGGVLARAGSYGLQDIERIRRLTTSEARCSSSGRTSARWSSPSPATWRT